MNKAEQELAELEKRYWQAIQDRDVEAALHLSDDPCVIVGAQGAATIDHRAMDGMFSAGSWTLRSFALDNVQVRMLGNDLGIVAYKVREELTVEGKPVTVEAFDASTWIRRDGKWVCALHTESLAGDPFGRDRRAG